MTQSRPNFNQAVRSLLKHVSATMPEFSHIRPSRILVVGGEARRASRGTVKPLVYSAKGRRQKSIVRIKGRRMLYCITLRPLFFRSSTPQARIETLLHELFHISPAFDGTLDQGRRHAAAGKRFERKLRPIVKRYLTRCPPELWALFAFNGEIRMLQWLERPGAAGASVAQGRKVYTEEQLFYGPVRMLTRRTRPVRSDKMKLH